MRTTPEDRPVEPEPKRSRSNKTALVNPLAARL